MDVRLRELRSYLNMSQEEFGKRINLSKPTISAFETQTRNMTDRVVSDICNEFNVSEVWLRNGEGEMFISPDTFSLDEYATKNGLTDLEIDILKGYIELDNGTRKTLISHFKNIFDRHSEISVAKELSIDEEIERYRLELEAEKKGQTLSVLGDTEDPQAQ